MHILIGLCLAAFLLWAWLLGHWFARVIVFLGLLLCAAVVASIFVDKSIPGSVFAFLIGAGVAWAVASIPIWFWEWKLGISPPGLWPG